MERTLISWSLMNFVTIVLMAFLGWMIVGVVAQGVRKYSGGNDAA